MYQLIVFLKANSADPDEVPPSLRMPSLKHSLWELVYVGRVSMRCF